MVKHEAERGPADPGRVIKKLINQQKADFIFMNLPREDKFQYIRF